MGWKSGIPSLGLHAKQVDLGKTLLWQYEVLAPARSGEDGVEPGPPVGAAHCHFGPALP